MAQRITNPKGFLMIACNPLEASMCKCKYIHYCDMCGKEPKTLCYIAYFDSFYCPDCMRRFVHAYKHNSSKEEINNYNNIVSQINSQWKI